MNDQNNTSIGPNVKRIKALPGYPIHDHAQAQEQALDRAEAIRGEAREAGATLRVWGENAITQIGEFLKHHLRVGPLEDLQHAPWAERETVLNQINGWESTISQAIHRYMGTTASAVGEMQLLNPPLKSEHIEPFIHAVLEDRRVTLTALQPLSRLVEKLLTLKYRLHIDSSGSLYHHPGF